MIEKKVSRREFIKNAGLAVGGALAGAGGAGMVLAGGNRSIRVPRASGHVALVSPEDSACTGCGTCELVCAMAHGNAAGPSLRRIWLERDEVSLAYSVLPCAQCDFPACYYACPRKEKALCIDGPTGARYIETERCPPGCRLCIEACSLEPARINYDPEEKRALMCDLCKDRRQGPACVELCPAQCLALKA